MIHTATSTTIRVSWDEIECIHENGPNISYDVDFQRLRGADTIGGAVNNLVFHANGLQPFTLYTFRVRGVNDAGSGDYTQPITVITDEDCM